MKLASWNVNSLKVRWPQVQEWLASEQPDALCLQETKLEDAKFPTEEILAAGYQPVFSGQKTYNGVAILCRTSPEEVQAGIPGYEDPQKRVLAATVAGVRTICVYVPNGESVDSDKYQYKMEWLKRLTSWIKEELHAHSRLAVLGDFNIAPEERDVHDPKVWEGKVLFSLPERSALSTLMKLGLTDSFRIVNQNDGGFTWWDYRMNAFKRNLGLRIDHILLSDELAKSCKGFTVHREMRSRERPSDHAPVSVDVAI
ncbi:MAG: exodeoxyribonuclease III [Deltaproteobacteria bacterium]|nr:exodeoxyribonuclease III [Deltaproteobacteria bacterium]